MLMENADTLLSAQIFATTVQSMQLPFGNQGSTQMVPMLYLQDIQLCICSFSSFVS